MSKNTEIIKKNGEPRTEMLILDNIQTNFILNYNLTEYEKIIFRYIIIPMTMYNIDQYSNTFTYSENGIKIQISIPIRNYTIIELINYIQEEMIIHSNFGIIYTITFSLQTGKISIDWDNKLIELGLLFSNNISKKLGFEIGNYSSILDPIISPNICNMMQNLVVINCNLINDGILHYINLGQYNTSQYEYFTHEGNNLDWYFLQLRDTNQISIKITNIDGQLINLNGNKAYLCISFI